MRRGRDGKPLRSRCTRCKRSLHARGFRRDPAGEHGLAARCRRCEGQCARADQVRREAGPVLKVWTGIAHLDFLTGRAPDPAEVVGAADAFEALLLPLTGRARALLRLVYRDGHDVRAAGRALGISPAGAYRHHAAALGLLRARITTPPA